MNTEQQSCNQTKVLRVFFGKKNPFLPAKDFRVSSTAELTSMCLSVFIGGFIKKIRAALNPRPI